MNSIFHKLFYQLKDTNRFERIWKLAQVDYKKRYYNDRLGIIWAILNPLFKVLIYYIVFELVMGVSGEYGNHYGLYLFVGLIAWMAIRETIAKSMHTLISKRYLIMNIKLDLIDLYISSSISIVFGLLFNIFTYIIVSLFFSISYSLNVLYLPIIILNVFFLATGLGMILSIVNIFLKDIKHLVEIAFMIGLWTSGIFYDSKLILDAFMPYYYLNPVIGIIENLRLILLFNSQPNYILMNINLLLGLIFFIVGKLYVDKYSSYSIEKL